MRRAFHIVPGSAAGRGFLIGLSAFLLAVSAVEAYLGFTLPPSGQAGRVSLLLGALVVFCVAGLVLYTAGSMRNVQFLVSADALRVVGDLFGRTIPRSVLRAGEGRLVSLEGAYRPVWKTCGTGSPGYLAGWFRLANREKALLFVTDATRIVYLPTTQGYSVLLSVAEPEEFLRALRG
ncbi:MAG: hypothetical protein JO250_22335 [Armatimonadetes bacterium]|nr:hypothetical protein [Armatimonadota bacterium]